MTLTQTKMLPYNLQLEDGERLGALPDPCPIEDAMQQNRTIFYLMTILFALYEGREEVFIDAGTLVYYDRSDRNKRIAPDGYIAFGVDAAAILQRNGYLIWEAGKPPDFAMEVASESTARNDISGKRDLYAAIKVQEYWRIDATGGDLYGEPLVGETLVDGEYRRLTVHRVSDTAFYIHSDVLNLDFYWLEDEQRARIYDPVIGEFLRDTYEMTSALVSEQEALVAEQQAHAETQAAYEASQAEIAQLRAELRRVHGLDG